MTWIIGIRKLAPSPRIHKQINPLNKYTKTETGSSPATDSERVKMMTLTDAALAVPNYVLMQSNRPMGPKVDPDGECLAIYGFSDKLHFDKFNQESEQGVTPYPLVKGYLQNQISGSDNRLKLVIINASDPHEPVLHATTMESVLEASEARTSHLSGTHRLVLDPSTNVYRIDVSSG